MKAIALVTTHGMLFRSYRGHLGLWMLTCKDVVGNNRRKKEDEWIQRDFCHQKWS